MKFEIKSRFSSAVLFTAELEAKYESEPASVQLGAAIKLANLARANLDGALLLGKHPVIQLGPLGSRSAYLIAYLTDAGIKVKAGCFFGTLAEFEAAAANTHDDNEHGRDYVAAVAFIKAHFEIWK